SLIAVASLMMASCSGGGNQQSAQQTGSGLSQQEEQVSEASDTPEKNNEQTVVRVSGGVELVKALKSNTRIIIDCDITDLYDAVEGACIANDISSTDKELPVSNRPELIKSLRGLAVMNMENITIEGDGVRKLIRQDDYFHHILYFVNCKNISLKNLTLGHTQTDGCGGYVVCLHNCENVRVEQSDLYGCGEIGLWADKSNNVQVDDCNIYDCSDNAVALQDSHGLVFNNCTIADIRTECLWLDNSDAVFNRCVFDVEEYGNSIKGAVFNNCKVDAGIDFEAPDPVNLPVEPEYDGEEVDSEEPFYYLESLDGICNPIPGSFSDKIIHVKNGVELINAIGDNRTIIIDEDIPSLDKSIEELANAGKIKGQGPGYFEKGVGFSGDNNGYTIWGLVVYDVHNLKIEGKKPNTLLQSACALADLINFNSCSNIALSNLNMGHVYMQNCKGDVIAALFCKDIKISNCGIYGCGVNGVVAERCDGIRITDSKIHHCSKTGLCFSIVKHGEINNCVFSDMYERTYVLDLSTRVNFIKCNFDVDENVNITDKEYVKFIDCQKRK
ncbi:MAG: right-handed parallel beta-helix repeat-containing protein, partial [Bacteroidales bacterium]|nr:right-handed parallel beta-helix repeat-containing protein [Bacteroidales bacterium]